MKSPISIFSLLALAFICPACAYRISLDDDLCEDQPVVRETKPEKPFRPDRHSNF